MIKIDPKFLRAIEMAKRHEKDCPVCEGGGTIKDNEEQIHTCGFCSGLGYIDEMDSVSWLALRAAVRGRDCGKGE